MAVYAELILSINCDSAPRPTLLSAQFNGTGLQYYSQISIRFTSAIVLPPETPPHLIFDNPTIALLGDSPISYMISSDTMIIILGFGATITQTNRIYLLPNKIKFGSI